MVKVNLPNCTHGDFLFFSILTCSTRYHLAALMPTFQSPVFRPQQPNGIPHKSL
jgi:hypothetical protein